MDRRRFLLASGAAGAYGIGAAEAQNSRNSTPGGETAYTAQAATSPQGTAGITRHMVTIGRRQVHLRRAGSGPPVLLLHSSPSTSRVFVSHMARLRDRFTLFALDTPGNGLSEVLEDDAPDIGLYSQNIVQVMDALGLEQCTLLGGYTGGIIALDASMRFPERIPASIVHGYLQLVEEERRDFLRNYLVPVVPDVFGAYLIQAWSHFRDGGLFFPWFNQDAKHRRVAGIPSPAAITRSIIDVLRAGDGLRVPYRAALSADTGATLASVRNSLTITMSPEDEMWPHRLRMPALPTGVTFVPGRSTAECITIWDRTLEANKTSVAVPSAKRTAPIRGAIWADMTVVDGVSVYVRRNDDGRGAPVIFLHDTDESSRSYDRWMRPFIGRRPVMAPDLPGRGETELPDDAVPSIAVQARSVAALLAQYGVKSAYLVAFGFSATLGVELAHQLGPTVSRLALVDTRFPSPEANARYASGYAPSIALDPYGNHLTTAWNQVRDRQLFEPWFQQEAAAVVQGRELELAPQLLDARTVDLLKCFGRRQKLFADVFAYPIYERLGALRTAVLVIRPGAAFASVVRAQATRAQVFETPALSADALAQRLDRFFASGA